MKIYTKTHSNTEALNNHVAKIKKRGGSCKVTGNTVTYSFPPKALSTKKYDTKEKRLAMLKKPGRIITFKKGKVRHVISDGLEESSQGVRLKGTYGGHSEWFKNVEAMIKVIDWKRMEAWHADEVERSF